MLNDQIKHVAHISVLGTSAMLFEAPGAFTLPTQQRIWALARETQTWPGIREAAPGMTSLLLSFSGPYRDIVGLESRLRDAWERVVPDERHGKTVNIPVVYGGEVGPDLPAVAHHAGLSIDEVVAIHSGVDYPVFALGSHPGFGYLGSLDPRLHMPRKTVPILRAEAGSVSIGGMQTGVTSTAGPSGWHCIGRSERRVFAPDRAPPAELEPGDYIRFTVEKVHQ